MNHRNACPRSLTWSALLLGALVVLTVSVFSSTSITPVGASGVKGPGNLQGVVSGNSIQLTWEVPRGAAEITGYQVLRRRPQSDERSLLVVEENTGSTATEWTDTDVTAGTRYIYRVKAVAVGVKTKISKAFKITYKALPVPRDLTASIEDGGVLLTWIGRGETSVDGYRVFRRSPGSGETQLAVYVEDTGETATTWADPDTTEGEKYIYRVAALNGDVVGGWSAAGSVVVPEPKPASAQGQPQQAFVIVSPDYPQLPVGWLGNIEFHVSNLELDSDPDTVDIVFRVDIQDFENEDADYCENSGFGEDMEVSVVDDVHHMFLTVMGGACPHGTYHLVFTVWDGDGVQLARESLPYIVVGAGSTLVNVDEED